MLGSFVFFAVAVPARTHLLNDNVLFAVAARARAPMLSAYVHFSIAVLASTLQLFYHLSNVLFAAAAIQPQAC